MQDLFDKILAPYMGSMPEFIISILGLLGTLSYIVPENSRLGRMLGKLTGSLVKLKKFILKKKK